MSSDSIVAALARHTPGDGDMACRVGLPCDAALLAAEVARLRRLHDAAYVVVDLADSALMDHDLGGGSHLDGTMELLCAALMAYATVRDETRREVMG